VLRDLRGARYDIHHLIPLEYAHLFPGLDVNAAANLRALGKPVHKSINKMGNVFRKEAGDMASPEQVRQMEAITQRPRLPRWLKSVPCSRDDGEIHVMTNVAMLGLERLLAACEKYPVRAELRKPWGGVPTAGTSALGRPFDPMLAAFYSRLGGLHLYLKLFVEPCDEQVNGILMANEEEPDWPEPFRALLVFGREEALAYRYATVPSLADAQGLQPVVEVDPYEDIYALPVASNVDRFFDAYARYLELIYETPEFRDDPDARPTFPRGVPELIATDRTLVRMLVEGRFDSLMLQPGIQTEETHEYLRGWVAKLRAAG
jgi:hypothetical protein